MNMDVWYDLLVRELTQLDRAEELRQDAEWSVADDTNGHRPAPPGGVAQRPE